MAIVQSFGALQSIEPRPMWTGGVSGGSLSLYSATAQTYASIYRTQPNVRICVDFLARNIAQLGIHVFRRISDTDRARVSGHQLAAWLEKPNPATTRYRLIESLMSDLGIYFNAYWLKVRMPDALGLVRLPPDQMSVSGHLLPTAFVWTTPSGKERTFQPSEIVHFNGYNPDPDNPLMGLSPLETLRRILAEEYAAGVYRESLWGHAAKHEGVWTRTKDSPDYTSKQLEDWRRQWQEFANTSKAGQTAVGQRGWDFKTTSFSARDSEYIQGGKLRREVCAAAYHIPQPMVGILDHATFSNVKEQHKHLYQDSLGPWAEMIEQEFERQLLPECDDQRDIYVEFNIAAKLQGSFEERASAMQISVGRPWRTVNEARALDNLPRDTEPESDKIAPQQGGPAATQTDPTAPEPGDPDAAAALVIQATQARQRAKLDKVDEADRAEVFAADLARWNRELAEDLRPLLGDDAERVSHETNARTLAQLKDGHA